MLSVAVEYFHDFVLVLIKRFRENFFVLKILHLVSMF